jgi:hypothetical protein
MILDALDRSDQPRDVAPPLAEYDGTNERLDELIDAVRSLVTVTIAANSKRGKAPKMQPRQRPVTAFERVNHRRRSARHQQLASRILARRQQASE